MPFTIESPTTSTVFFFNFLYFVLAFLLLLLFFYFCDFLFSGIMLILSLTFRLIDESLTLIALRFVKTWCFLLRISDKWFSKFIFLCFFEKHYFILFLNCSSIINLLGATPPLLFLSWLFTINLLDGTSQLFFGVCGGFLVGVLKFLHKGGWLMLRFEFSLFEFWGNHGDAVACKRLDRLLYSLNKWFITLLFSKKSYLSMSSCFFNARS